MAEIIFVLGMSTQEVKRRPWVIIIRRDMFCYEVIDDMAGVAQKCSVRYPCVGLLLFSKFKV